MDSDASTLFGAILLAFLLIINFIMTAFLAAIRSISDSDLEEAFAAQGRPPDPVCELKDHPWRLTHTVWLLTLTSSKITEPLVCIMFNRSGLLSFTIQSSSSVIWVNALLLSKFCLNSCLFNSKTKKSPLFEVSILILIQRKGILFIPNKVSFECPL